MGSPNVVFFDCDDCLYQNNWATARKITDAIASHVAKLGVSKEKAYELYKTHGTCLKGLINEGIIDGESQVEEFLLAAHDIVYTDIEENANLRRMILRIKPDIRKFVFTASTKEHALRCLKHVNVADLFLGVIDTRVCKLDTKHAESSFRAAMSFADAHDPSKCLLIDDSVKNIERAKSMGWKTVLVGKVSRDTGEPITCDAADVHVECAEQLENEMPSLFIDL